MELLHHQSLPTQAAHNPYPVKCPHCGAYNQGVTREKPPHIGLYCGACDRWIRWIRRDRSEPPASVDQSQTIESSGSQHDQLAALLKTLTGIERQLTIITRALIGAGQ